MVVAVVVLAVVLAVLVGLLVGLLLSGKTNVSRRADVEVQTGIEVESSRLATRSGHIELLDVHRQTLIVNDGSTVWQIILENAAGLRRIKSFRGHLVLGRARKGAEPAGMLYLDADATVSKRQCEMVAFPTGLAVINCSQTSMTTVDGYPTAEPVLIRPGSAICMGRSVWRVVAVRAY